MSFLARSLPVALVTAALGLLVACSSSDDGGARRCEICGMSIDPSSGWRAGASGASGPLRFDTPKCLFRHSQQRGAVEEPWVTEYYSQERRSAAALFYVVGSDLEGPMGRDLVPVSGAAEAEGFASDHGGDRVLSYREVTPEVVAALFRPSP